MTQRLPLGSVRRPRSSKWTVLSIFCRLRAGCASFEEQRDRLAQEVALREVNDDFNRQVQRLIDESFAADDLQSVAVDLGLTLNESDWLARGKVKERFPSRACWMRRSLTCWKRATTA